VGELAYERRGPWRRWWPLVATRSHPLLRAFYQRLLERGKPKQVALRACMQKLVTMLNAMRTEQTPWRPTLVA
jgi:transposase